MKRTRFTILALALAFASSGVVPSAAAGDAKTLRIGYQKIGPLLILKQQGLLEKRFAAEGIAVDWIEFQSGPPLLEALNAGAIDFGYTGDTPPIFAQAAGSDLVYVAALPLAGANSAILVHKNSNIHTLADLRGKRLAFTKGSSAHNVVVRVLAKAGLAYGDIDPVYLQPADAAAAFRGGSVDAWSIWDPFYAVAERDPDTRVLTTALAIAPSNGFFLASRDYATKNPKVIEAIVQETTVAWHWAETHQDQIAQVLSETSGVDLAAERIAAKRGSYAVEFITPAVVQQQQSIADSFAKLGLIPKTIDVAAAAWSPAGKTATTSR